MRSSSRPLLSSMLLLPALVLACPNHATARTQSPDEGSLEDQEPPELDARRERRYILHNTWSGAVGGFRVVDAGSGADRTLRVSLVFGTFVIRDWLAPNERQVNISSALALGWTPTKFLEIYGAAGFWRDSNLQPDATYVRGLVQWTLGAKAFYPVRPWLMIGGDARLHLPLNTAAQPRRVFTSMSSGLRANLTMDLRELQADRALPLIIRTNVDYLFNRSSQLVAPLEQDRYDALLDDELEPRRDWAEEDRHIISRVERFGLQIDRTDRVGFGVGLEAPISARAGTMVVSPIAEWLLELPVERGRYVCRSSEVMDGCLGQVGGAGYRQGVVVGVRVMPPVRGLNLFVAGEIGLTGVRALAQELAPQVPYRVLVGVGYAWDPKWEALYLRR